MQVLFHQIHQQGTAGTVVKRARFEASMAFVPDRTEHHPVAGRNQRCCLLSTGGANINIQILERHCFAALLLIQQMDGFSADNAGNQAVNRINRHRAAGHHLQVDSPGCRHLQQPVLTDKGDQKANLVHVGIKHKLFSGALPAFFHRDQVPQRRYFNRICVGPDFLQDNLTHLLLRAGYPGGIAEPPQQRPISHFHAPP